MKNKSVQSNEPNRVIWEQTFTGLYSLNSSNNYGKSSGKHMWLCILLGRVQATASVHQVKYPKKQIGGS